MAYANELRTDEEIREDITRRAEHTERLYVEDELGLSVWANGINNELDARILEIRANGGMASFPALFDLEGTRVRAKLILVADRFAPWRGRKPVWAFCDEADELTGRFLTAFPVRESTLRRKGYVEGFEDAPAGARTAAPSGARGLAGALSVYVETYRRDRGYPENAKVVR